MNLLSISLLCLIAATQGENFKCDPRCIDEHGHSYETGKSYVYKYETVQNINSFIGLPSVADQTVNIKGEISLTPGQGKDKCQLSFDILSWTANFPEITLEREDEFIDQLLDIKFQEPAKFSYINGTVRAVCLPEDDVWKNNIRRSLINLFQTDFASLNLPFNVGQENTHDVVETGLFGTRVVRYYKFADPFHMSKVAVTSSSMQKFWTASGENPYSANRNIFHVFDTLKQFDNVEFGTTPLESHSNVLQKYMNLLINTKTPFITLDSVEICSQDFEGSMLKRINCTESRSHTSSIIRSELYTRSKLSFDRIIDEKQITRDENTQLRESTLEFDLNLEKPATNLIIRHSFDKMVQYELCKNVQETTNTKQLIEFVDILKNFFNKVTKADLDRNFKFVQDSLDCGTPNRNRQVEIYLHIAAMSPTDETVEFLVERFLESVWNVSLRSVLINIATMKNPGPRSLRAMKNLILNYNSISVQVPKIELLVASSSIARIYQNRLLVTYQTSPYQPFSATVHSEFTALLRTIDSNVEDLDRLEKMEVLRGLRDFTKEQNVNTCDKLAKDDFERLRCQISCDYGESISSTFAKNLLENSTAQPGARIAAWLQISKCLLKDHLHFFSAQLNVSNNEVKEFIKSHITAVNGMSKDFQLQTYEETGTSPTVHRSRTIVKLNEFSNVNHMDHYEGNIVFGTSWIPRIITAEYGISIKNQVFRYLEMEIIATNFDEDRIEVLLTIRRYGTTLYCRSLIISPTVYWKWLQNKNHRLDDILRLFASRIPELLNLIPDRNFEHFSFNELLEQSLAIPTISGLPFKQSMEFDVLGSLKLTINKMRQFGNPEFGPTMFEIVSRFARKHAEKTVLRLGNNEIIGYQYNGWKQFNTGISMSLTIRSGLTTFHIGFPKHRGESNETGYVFRKSEEYKFQKVQLLNDFTKYQVSSPLHYKESDRQTESENTLFGTLNCGKTVTGSEKYVFRSNQCKMADWFLKISYEFGDPQQKSMELKIHPTQSMKSNTFVLNLTAKLPQAPDQPQKRNQVGFLVGHELELLLKSPYKDVNLNWKVSIVKKEEGSTSVSVKLNAAYDQSNYSAEVYMSQKYSLIRNYPACLETDRVSCRHGSCDYCKYQHDFGLIVKTPIKGLETIVLVKGYFDVGFTDAAILYAESNGITKSMDSTFKVQFKSLMVKTKDDSNLNSKLFSLEAQNNYLGKFDTTTSWSLHENNTETSVSVKYGKVQPFNTFLLKSLTTTCWILKQSNESVQITSRAPSFPVFDFDYKFDRREQNGYDPKDQIGVNKIEVYEEEVTSEYSIPEPSIKITMHRTWKHVQLVSLLRYIFNSKPLDFGPLGRLVDINSFDVKNELQIVKNGVSMISSKFYANREKSSFKFLDFRFQIGSEEETMVKWESSDTELSLKTQVNVIGTSHKMKHHVTTNVNNKWVYEGEYNRMPGTSYIASGHFGLDPSKKSSITFTEIDVSIVEKDTANAVQIVYNKTILSENTTTYLRVLEKTSEFQNILFEYTAKHYSPSYPLVINMKMSGYFETELVVLIGPVSEARFVTKLIPMGLNTNGSVTFSGRHRPERIPKLTATVDWVTENDPSEFGRFDSYSKIDPYGDIMIQSSFTISIGDRLSNFTFLSSFDIDDKPSPLIYIYFTDPDGQKHGVNLTTVLELYGDDDAVDDIPEHQLGIVLKGERPGVEPFLIEYSLKAFQNLKWYPSPGDDFKYHWFGHNFTSFLRFVHQDNVLFFFPMINNDWTLRGNIGLFQNESRALLPEWTNIQFIMDADLIAKNLQWPIIKLHSNLNVDITDDDSDILLNAFVQKDALKYDVKSLLLERFSRQGVHQKEGDEILPIQNIWETIFSNYGSVSSQILSYQISTMDIQSDEKSLNLVGSHNLTTSFESWNNFEAEMVNKVQCGESNHFVWTDAIKRTIKDDNRQFQLVSSKLFKIKTCLDEHSIFANVSILHPSHQFDSFTSFDSLRPTNDKKLGWNLEVKFSNKMSTTGGLKITHVHNIKENASHDFRTVVGGHLNQFTCGIENDVQLDASQHASSMKHSIVFKLDYGYGTQSIYNYTGATVVGEVHEIAEILHHDYLIDVGNGFSTTGSMTITSPAYLPLLFELIYSTNVHAYPEFVPEFFEKQTILILLGKIPECDCDSNEDKALNLLKHHEFPLDLKTLTKLTQKKLYCNKYSYIGIHKYSAFRKKDGRIIFKFAITNGTLEDVSSGYAVEKTDFETVWEDNQCVSWLHKEGNTRKNYNQNCNLVLMGLPACGVQPNNPSCKRSERFWSHLTIRNAISRWAGLKNLIIVFFTFIAFSARLGIF